MKEFKEISVKKFVIIVMVSVLVGVSAGLGIFLIFSRIKSFDVYDLRIVYAVSENSYYIYTDSDSDIEYEAVKDQKINLTSSEEDILEIGVYVDTTATTIDATVVSSDTSVARVEFVSGRCYIYFLRAGTVTITASFEDMSDSVTFEIYDDNAEYFVVYDDDYYGEYLYSENYASTYQNNVNIYADDQVYSFRFEVSALSSGEASDGVDSELLRVDTTNVDFDNIFWSISIDAENQLLNISCRSTIVDNISQTILIQSYYVTETGEIKPANSYEVYVHIIAYTPEFLQIELATSPSFEDSYIFMDTINPLDDLSDIDVEDILSALRAELNLTSEGESPVYQVFFTSSVQRIYIRFRVVYTNGDIVYFNDGDEIKLNNLEDDDTTIIFSVVATSTSGEGIKTWYDGSYSTLTLSESDFSSGSFRITLTISGGYNLTSTFEFSFKELNEDNVLLFYSYDDETGIYTYTYWDLRTRYTDVICDENGNIVGFKFD